MANPFDQFDAPAEPKPSAPAVRTPADFTSTYGGAAKRAGEKIGVDPNVLLGQWGLETGWGKSVVPGTNNLGNIKDMTGSGVAATDNMTGSKDKYRTFATPDDFADHYADLISRKYQGAVGSGSDASKFAGALTAGGYAEDPNYAAKIQAAHRMVSKAGNPVLRAANAVTSAIMPSANAATPPAANPFDQFDGPAAAPNPTGKAAQPNAKPLSKMDKFAQGLRDQVDGGAQLLTQMLPDSVVQAGNAANNWLADKTGLVGKLPEGGVDQQVRESGQAYNQARAANGETGIDGYRLLGNVMSPANLAAAAKLPQAASLIGRIGLGAAVGAGSGALAPVESGDFSGEKIKQVGLGAIAGGAIPAVTGAIARIVSPNASTNANLQLLKDEGIKPTIGQTLGGAWNTAEQKLQSVPILGDAITAARGKTRDQLNTAAYNRALNPIGQEAQASAVGREGVQSVKNALGKAYDNLLPNLKFQSDQQFGAEMSNLTNMVANGNVQPKFAKQFNSIIKNEVTARMTPQGAMDGQSFKALESSLSQKIKDFAGAQDPDQRALGSALQEVLSSARGVLSRANPQYADQLASINKGYANYATIRRAASGVGAEEGIFTPAQLQSAVRAGDKSAGKGSFATGNGLMQDLSEAGKTVLGNKYPDSGTAGRLMGGIGALATGAINPAIPAALIGGAAAYSKPVQSILNAAVSARPQIAQPAAGAIRKYAASLVPLGAQLGLEAGKN